MRNELSECTEFSLPIRHGNRESNRAGNDHVPEDAPQRDLKDNDSILPLPGLEGRGMDVKCPEAQEPADYLRCKGS